MQLLTMLWDVIFYIFQQFYFFLRPKNKPGWQKDLYDPEVPEQI
jgi:hypothetical protein